MRVAHQAAFLANAAGRGQPEAVNFAALSVGQAVAVAHVAAHDLGDAAYAIRPVGASVPPEEAAEARATERGWQRERIPATLRELAMGPVGLTPGLEQLHDRRLLPVQQPVQRVTARWGIGQVMAGGAARGPAGHPQIVHVQQMTRGPGRPAAGHGVLDQIADAGFDGCLYSGRDRANSQSQRDFPRLRCSSIAWAVIVARSCSSSARASSSSTCSALLPGRPGLADSPANAPSLAERQIVVTVEPSTRHFAAASRWVNCPVNTEVNNSHFSLGGNTRRALRPSSFFTGPADDTTILQTCQTRPQVAGYFQSLLPH